MVISLFKFEYLHRQGCTSTNLSHDRGGQGLWVGVGDEERDNAGLRARYAQGRQKRDASLQAHIGIRKSKQSMNV